MPCGCLAASGLMQAFDCMSCPCAEIVLQCVGQVMLISKPPLCNITWPQLLPTQDPVAVLALFSGACFKL